jgi:uncharacterized membrane-anchored protein
MSESSASRAAADRLERQLERQRQRLATATDPPLRRPDPPDPPDSPDRHDQPNASSTARHALLKVPEITAYFWITKALTTAMGESTSDYLVHKLAPFVAVALGAVGLAVALALQFRATRYVAWTYWLAVAMVGIFGTMAADVLHVGLGVPYTASTILYAIVLILVFVAWQRTEKTLSIHSIDSPRREAFYWATVAATFAMGTALGDFTAYTLHLGFFPSAVLFAAVIAVPAFGFRFLRWNAILSFWFAYVITRPLGASIADGLAKSRRSSGLGIGDGPVVLVLGILIAVAVAYLAITKADVQPAPTLEAERA